MERSKPAVPHHQLRMLLIRFPICVNDHSSAIHHCAEHLERCGEIGDSLLLYGFLKPAKGHDEIGQGSLLSLLLHTVTLHSVAHTADHLRTASTRFQRAGSVVDEAGLNGAHKARKSQIRNARENCSEVFFS